MTIPQSQLCCASPLYTRGPYALNYISLFDCNVFSQLSKLSGFAAGDKHLTFGYLIQYKILTAGVQLGKYIIQ